MARHKDKYASLASGPRPRQCSTAMGVAKRTYTREKAEVTAERMRDEGVNPWIEAYNCKNCDWWHVGTAKHKNRVS